MSTTLGEDFVLAHSSHAHTAILSVEISRKSRFAEIALIG